MENLDKADVITINRPVGVLYFSDGVEEVLEERKEEPQECEPDSSHVVDPVSV